MRVWFHSSVSSLGLCDRSADVRSPPSTWSTRNSGLPLKSSSCNGLPPQTQYCKLGTACRSSSVRLEWKQENCSSAGAPRRSTTSSRAFSLQVRFFSAGKSGNSSRVRSFSLQFKVSSDENHSRPRRSWMPHLRRSAWVTASRSACDNKPSPSVSFVCTQV